jgi:hypothetical protein
MALAQIGPLTTVLEVAATAVGASVVLLSVAAGIFGLAWGRSRQEVEDGAAVGGFVGGGIGVAAVLIDLALRYAG